MSAVEFALRGDHITLDALLKATGLAPSGGSAKGQEKGGAGDTVRHAEGAVDDLARQADKDGNQEIVGHSERVNRVRDCAEGKSAG